MKFNRFGSLQTLNLEMNRLSTIPETSFSGLTKLVSLNLASNDIQSLPAMVFDHQQQMTYLNVSDNRIDNLPNGLFNKTYSLQQLILGRNSLRDNSLPFLNTPYLALLKELHLNGNNLKNIPYLAFNNLASLEQLFILKANVESIDSNALVGLTSMRLLDISANNMTTLKREVLQSVPDISQLGLAYNPLQCSCDIKQIQDFLKQYSVTLLKETTCSFTDDSTKNIEIDDLDFLCDLTTKPSTSSTVAPYCGQNMTLEVKMLAVDSMSALIKWEVKGGTLPPEAVIMAFVRNTEEDTEDSFVINTPPETPVSISLEPGTPYVVCLYQTDCLLRSCLNIAGHQETEISTAEAVGITSACFVVILGLLITVIVVVCKGRRKSYQYKKTDQEEATNRDEKPGTSEDTYEKIPSDVEPKRRHANDALPQPGLDEAQAPGGALSQVVTSNTEASSKISDLKPPQYSESIKRKASPVQTNKSASKAQTAPAKLSPPATHKFDKKEPISAGKHTKVFRKPDAKSQLVENTETQSPPLPRKSAHEFRATEGNKHSPFTYIEPEKSRPLVVPTSPTLTGTEGQRSPHIYNEPEFTYENEKPV